MRRAFAGSYAWRAAAAALLALLTLALPAGAQSVAPAPEPGPPVWKVSGGKSALWLFGTVDAPLEFDGWRRAPLLEALEAVESVYFEEPIVSHSMSQAQLSNSYGRLFGRALRGALRLETAAALERFNAAFGLADNYYDANLPWYVADDIEFIESAGIVEKSLGPGFLGRRLARLAQRDGKATPALGPMHDYFKRMSALPMAEQIEVLEWMLDRRDSIGPRFRSQFNAWLAGDMKTLEALLAERWPPAVVDVIVTQRNSLWSDTLVDILEGDKDALAVIRVEHLVGADGVLGRLEARGYGVERL